MQSDDLGLVERLRCGVQENAPYSTVAGWNIGGADYLMQEAAAAIERLVAERDGAREALKPFAKYSDELNGFLDNHNQPLPDDQGPGWVYVTIGDFRRARQALKDAP